MWSHPARPRPRPPDQRRLLLQVTPSQHPPPLHRPQVSPHCSRILHPLPPCPDSFCSISPQIISTSSYPHGCTHTLPSPITQWPSHNNTLSSIITVISFFTRKTYIGFSPILSLSHSLIHSLSSSLFSSHFFSNVALITSPRLQRKTFWLGGQLDGQPPRFVGKWGSQMWIEATRAVGCVY